jgi:hypothetical protein
MTPQRNPALVTFKQQGNSRRSVLLNVSKKNSAGKTDTTMDSPLLTSITACLRELAIWVNAGLLKICIQQRDFKAPYEAFGPGSIIIWLFFHLKTVSRKRVDVEVGKYLGVLRDHLKAMLEVI